MRLTVLVPAYNEEASISQVIHDMPHTFPGISAVSVVVVDDGSTDATVSCARQSGAHVLVHPEHRGLAAAFRTGCAYALKNGADLIATLDADGQYVPAELSLLLQTLRTEKVSLVVGDRQIRKLKHMPLGNWVGNIVGSAMLRVLRLTDMHDASSGFRMFTRAFAQRLDITGEHTYTHEMLIQATAARVRTAEIPVTFLPRLHGNSKLIRSVRQHIFRSCGTILRSVFLYHPLPKFLLLSICCFSGALMFLAIAATKAFPLSLLLASGVFVMLGIQFVVTGLLADAQAAARRVRANDSSNAV